MGRGRRNVAVGAGNGEIGHGSCGKGTKTKRNCGKINKAKKQRLDDEAGIVDKVRLMAVTAPHAGAWLGAVPSRALDLLMTNDEIRCRVGRRLGASIGEEGPCMFCMQCNDVFEIHAESCMG